ncbi:MAG: aldehyde dehydrogenase family protein [Candidatus Obscuribacterales bacterium]|nr:aldehyde dehydrogenase family protein [Candidatus Obscuribacterales bacterium]
MLGLKAVPERVEAWINGRFQQVSSGKYFEIHNPSSGEVLSSVACCQQAEIDLAVRSSREALEKWRSLPSRSRGLMLRKMAEELESRCDEFALVETLNCGKPLSEAKQDVIKSAESFAFYSELSDKLFGKTIPISSGYHSYTIIEPRGVTAHISPWNYPLRLSVRSLAPALASGNSAVLKPSEYTPLTAIMLAQLFKECGLPDGLLNVVTGLGKEAGAFLAQHSGIQQISFTGSVPTGIEVARIAASNIIPCTLELGGKSANIVFADADLEAAVQGAKKAIFANSGQVCCAGSRLFVQSRMKDELLSKLAKEAKEMSIGAGLSNPQMGPLISKEQHQKVLNYIELGKTEGAKLRAGGNALKGGKYENGYFVEATIFDEVKAEMRIAREEIFGPVLCTFEFEEEAEVLELANASEYGLVAGIWTKDLDRAHKLAAGLEVGQVYINDFFGGAVANPFGGCKKSGFGRERGVEAFDNYTQVKSVCIKFHQDS